MNFEWKDEKVLKNTISLGSILFKICVVYLAFWNLFKKIKIHIIFIYHYMVIFI